MGAIIEKPEPALLFFSLLACNAEGLDTISAHLEDTFGPLALRSEPITFDHTNYYEREMGAGLIRQWAASERLIDQEMIVDIKRQSNEIEDTLRAAAGGRTVNVDPGYINLAKVVLATTKDFAHRLYLARGIFAEVTLTYRAKDKGFAPWPWTYPDHAEPVALRFFNEAREIYKRRMREWRRTREGANDGQ